MKSDIELHEGVNRMLAEEKGRLAEDHARSYGPERQGASPLDPWLCVIGAMVCALALLGVAYAAFCYYY